MGRAIGGELGRGEEVKLLAGAGASDIEEPLALRGLAGAVDSVEPVVERLRRLAAAGDGREHEVCCVFAGGVQRFEFGPCEQAGAVCRGLAFEGRDHDDVPLQPLGLVDGEQFDEGGPFGGWIGFSVGLLQAALQEGWVEKIDGPILFQFKLQFIQ